MLSAPTSRTSLFSLFLGALLLAAAPPLRANDITWVDPESSDSQAPLASGMEAALFALAFTGTPYRYGGTSPTTGMDCSGFVSYVFRESFGLILPRTAAEIAQAGMPVEKNALIPGDLVFYNTLGASFSHVGIYLGDNKFVHSPRAGAQIRVEDMQLPYWKKRFEGARRIDAN